MAEWNVEGVAGVQARYRAGREAQAGGGQSTVPERVGRKPPLNQGGAVSPAPFMEDDVRPTDVRERPGALAAA